MRELTLLETGCLAGLLLLSLVLPMRLSGRVPRKSHARRASLGTVWLGQILLGVAAILILVSPGTAPFALAFGMGSCAMCTVVLQDRLRMASVGTAD
jgi:hypothetical protein